LAAYDTARRDAMAGARRNANDIRFDRVAMVSQGRSVGLYRRLGRLRDADSAIRESLPLAESIHTADPSNMLASLDLALAHVAHGRVLSAMGHHAEAIREFRRAAGLYAKLPPVIVHLMFRVEGLTELGLALAQQHPAPSPGQAEETLAEALQLAEQGLTQAPSQIILLRERARARYGMALVARARHSERAGTWLRQSVDDWRLLRQRSPLDREGLEEQRAAEALLESHSR
jgi:tetratricopeptide (TPR) repeat protein